jgi:hypothetical protein
MDKDCGDSSIEEHQLNLIEDGGAILTSPLQVKWVIPYYCGLFKDEFIGRVKKLSSAKQLMVRKIGHGTANEFCKNHHYLKRKIYIAKNISYGVFFEELLVGVIMFGYPVWVKYPQLVPPNLSSEVPELLRLSLLSCCPKNSASRVIGVSSRLLINDWMKLTGVRPKIIFSMSDKSLGFSGSIYKASGFEFLKSTSGRAANIGGTHGKWKKNEDHQIAKKDVWIKKVRDFNH